MRYIAFDIETAAHPRAAEWLDPPQPAANLKDPEKIAADIAEKVTKQRDGAALDWNVGRVAALGVLALGGEATVWHAESEAEEKDAIGEFWRLWRRKDAQFVCYNGRSFDLPFLLQRSRYLGVDAPVVSLGKFRRYDDKYIDIYDVITFQADLYRAGSPVMRQTLRAFGRRFGIPVAEEAGSEIARYIEEGNRKGVEDHLRCDLHATLALAVRLRLIPSTEEGSK